ncbi:nucleoside hydrolase [Sphingobacterium sp. DK4209]|uniref:Nucleoside hydrolase n=1 Tax=Sphingobacterium zhuxiongii TaxID=2662364 RepID=A0A5Q0QBJ7_9SPHI|nr:MULTISPECIES: nucleoside hydrolase [unclassified Sphingobacterium]MVZ66248.1 nucleoside hydrolase [Sphingobacterium sp. DK4209]QGA24972.1 nucleoside hydrolase [Sphingobacterium sp. dk4302]
MSLTLKKLSIAIALAISLPTMTSAQQKIKKPVKVIFDTDMGPDYDDIGAIALLHALADQNELEILATVASDAHVDIAPTIALYNRYFNKPHIPVGEADKTLAPSFTAKTNWNDVLIKRFDSDLKNQTFPAAVDVYREVLAKQPDNSVTIITVGFMTNLAQLLKSTADQHSNLNGMDLVKKKVKNWVAMAAAFPQGKEFNVFKDSVSSYYVFQHFPKPILFSGFEIGDKIKSGAKIASKNDQNSPVSVGYKLNLDQYGEKPVKNRSSWDQTAVLIAARNPEDYFYLSGKGKIDVAKDGSNIWIPDDKGNHQFIIHKYPYQKIEEIIEELMMHQPKKK